MTLFLNVSVITFIKSLIGSRFNMLCRSKTSVGCNERITAEELSEAVLPTCLDILKYYKLIQTVEKSKLEGFDPPARNIANIVGSKVHNIWSRASVSCAEPHKISERVLKLHTELQSLNKSYHRAKSSINEQRKVDLFFKSLNKLFDVCTCKCTDYVKCCCKNKINPMERSFIADQRGERKMYIKGVDSKTTKLNEKRLLRKEKETESLNKRLKRESDSRNVMASYSSSSVLSGSTDDCFEKSQNVAADDSEWSHKKKKPHSETGQTRIRLQQFSQVCDRTGIADRPAALLASAILADIDKTLPPENEINFIIDRNKVRREKFKTRTDLQSKQFALNQRVPGIYFDGRSDHTNVLQAREDGKNHQNVVTEHHLSLVGEPGSFYLGHITPASRGADGAAQSIWYFLRENEVDISSIRCAGSDGEITNTGNKSGVISRLEKYLNRPLLWSICQLHTNELPLRHLIIKLDGETSGPCGFTGPVGKCLSNAETRPIVEYEVIKAKLPDVDTPDLSKDQDYLLQMCKAVISGECSASLAARIPGPINHSRWLTTACRILREYVSNVDPSPVLKTLATFIVKVYAPMWFYIKTHQQVTDGPKNLWLTLIKMRYLDDELKAIVHPVLQRNSHWAHPENMLLAMLADDREEIRIKAAKTIRAARQDKVNIRRKMVRKRILPDLKFVCDDYTEMIDWEQCTVTEPPVTVSLTEAHLRELESGNREPLLSLQKYLEMPCHSQAVERMVKDVSDASKHVYGQVARDGFIRAKIADRALNPKFETKKDFSSLS